MSEILPVLFFSILIVLAIAGAIIFIPILVTLSTESENEPNHIYNIYSQEAGFRGIKANSAIGCLFSFSLLAHPDLDQVAALIFIIFTITSGFYHAPIYRNYPVVTSFMLVTGLLSLIFLTAISLLVRVGTLPPFIFMLTIVLIGGFWGHYAVYRRAKLIRLERLSDS